MQALKQLFWFHFPSFNEIELTLISPLFKFVRETRVDYKNTKQENSKNNDVQNFERRIPLILTFCRIITHWFCSGMKTVLLLHFLKKIDHCNTPFHRFSQNFPLLFLCKMVVPISLVETFLCSWSLCMAWRFVCSRWQETPELSSTVLEQDRLSPTTLDHQSNYQKYCLAVEKTQWKQSIQN